MVDSSSFLVSCLVLVVANQIHFVCLVFGVCKEGEIREKEGGEPRLPGK